MNKHGSNKNDWLNDPLHPLGSWLKLSVLAFVSVVLKSTPTQPTWAVMIVLFAALLLVPIGFQLVRKSQSLFRMDAEGLVLHLPCALFLALSFLLDRGTLAGVFALPYATWCVETLLRGVKIDGDLVYLLTLTAFMFLATGAIWLLFDRFGIQPLGFATWIVILTSVHFHYAGFTLLTSMVLFLYQKPKDSTVQTVSILIIMGVLLTAIGITFTQLGYPTALESFAGVWMGSSAMFAGFVIIQKSILEKMPTKILWLLAGICLILAMILACFYALRSLIPLDLLTLPFMQTAHGTLNALGFGTLMLLGWAMKKPKSITYNN